MANDIKCDSYMYIKKKIYNHATKVKRLFNKNNLQFYNSNLHFLKCTGSFPFFLAR